MKTLYTFSLLAVLGTGLIAGCETSHSESTKTNPITGTQKHEETTVTKNPITGDTSVQHSEQKVNP